MQITASSKNEFILIPKKKVFWVNLLGTTLYFFTLTIFLTSFVSGLLVSATATAQSKRNDPNVAAQQAFVRLDYANALRFALEGLKQNPQNLELRRIAARSALEMQRTNDCLRIMNGVPVARANTDDVNIIGECATATSTPSWVLALLQKALGKNDTKDSANFWIGKYYYKKGDYFQSKQFLEAVVLLPARFEKERRFMLERSSEVLAAAKAGTTITADQSEVAPAPPVAPAQPAVNTKPENAERERPNALKAPQTQIQSAGLANTVEFSSEAGLQYTNGTSVSLNANEQTAYEAQLGTRDPGSAIDKIDTKKLKDTAVFGALEISNTLALQFAGTGAGGGTGGSGRNSSSGASAGPGNKGLGNSFLGVRVKASGAFTNSTGQWENTVYAYSRRNLPRLAPFFAPRKGWEASFGPAFEWFPFRNLHFSGEATAGYTSALPASPSRIFRTRGSVTLAFDYFQVSPAAGSNFHFSPKGTFAAWDSQFDFDLNIYTLGIWESKGNRLLGVGFGQKQGYPFFAFTRLRPKPSEDVVKFTGLEGNFLEFNLAPFVEIAQAFEISLLYRYVAASRQSYTPPSVSKQKEEIGKQQSDWSLYQPTAEYKTSSAEWMAELTWQASSQFQLQMGAFFRRSITQYTEGNGTAENLEYAGLIDRGGDSWNRYHIGFGYKF